ncbi:MAG: hypothetical protein ICV63_14350 [Coleofasciculus sp. Co-bin14]|nr:hypothetical protein [Coleofasciculus sp. Co-bin14]
MNTQAQIAQHLNLAQELIVEVQEWARVLWVRIEGMRPRFVSKKVTMSNPVDPFELAEKEQDDRADQADAMVAKIDDHLPMGHCIPWSKLHSAAVDVLEGNCTFQEAVERFTSKKIIKKGSK